MQTIYPPASTEPPSAASTSLLQRLSGTLRQRPVQLAMLLLLALIFMSALSLPVLVVLGGYSYYQVTGTIAPGVQVGATHLDWMGIRRSSDRAAQELESQSNDPGLGWSAQLANPL